MKASYFKNKMKISILIFNPLKSNKEKVKRVTLWVSIPLGLCIGSQREALSGLFSDIFITFDFPAYRTIVVPVTKVDSFFLT